MGADATARGVGSAAFGLDADAVADGSFAFGARAKANATDAVALPRTTATEEASLAVAGRVFAADFVVRRDGRPDTNVAAAILAVAELTARIEALERERDLR